MFESLFSWTGASVLVNIGLAVAGALGWKHASAVKGGLRSVLQGVESVVASFESSTEQKSAKSKLEERNIANGAEKVINKELQRLGYSKGKK